MEPLIHAEHLHLSRQGRLILEDISLTLNAGDIVTIIGPNGAGKTSLLRVLLGLLTPDSGQVTHRDGLRIGYVPQRFPVDPALPMTVHRFLRLPLHSSPDTIRQALSEVEAAHLEHQPLQSLSGGELQRVLLARAVLQQPDVLVLDEPDQGVDIDGQAKLYQHLQHVRDRLECSILLVSHELHLVMAASSQVYCINRHICCAGTPENIQQDPAYIALFGKHAAEAIAPYTHHHDHQHGWGKHECEHDHG